VSFWSRIRGWVAKDQDTNRFFWDLIGGSRTTGGVIVTQKNAMRLSAVWACVTVRAEDTAKLPCHLYRRRKDGGKERATDHPVYRLIHDQANYRHTAFEFKQLMQMQCDLDGNAYAIKEFNGRGRVTALWPVESCRVQILKSVDGHELFYRFNLYGGETITLPAEGVFHLRGNSIDGICGMSPIAWQRETIGHAMAAEKYGAAFFGNSAQPNGALVMPNKISKEAADALRADWKARFQGPENAHNLAIFDTGMDWKQIGMTNVDSQFIEARQMQNSEIWRIYRMPPHKVGDLSKATFSNIEMQSIEYVQDCLMSIFERWQQALARDLLLDSEQGEYFFEFLPDALLKGDIKSRFDAYAVATTNGWLSVNDIRDRENMNRIDDGDQYFRPMNLQPLDMPQLPPEKPPAPAKPKRRSKTDA
jgi:HK97 family phage portal protein